METMKHEFGGYIPHIALIYLLIPLAWAKMWAPSHISSATLSCPQSLYKFFYFTHLPAAAFSLPCPAETCRVLPAPIHPLQQAEQGAAHATNGSDQRAAGMHGLIGQKPTTPRTQTGQVVPNPPALPAFLWSASLTSLLIITVVIGIWGLFLSKFCGWPWSTGSRALEEDRHAVKSLAKRSS